MTLEPDETLADIQALVGRAAVLLSHGRAQDALSTLLPHENRFGASAEAHYYLAAGHLAIGAPEEATKTLMRALCAEPGHARALVATIVVASKSGDLASAVLAMARLLHILAPGRLARFFEAAFTDAKDQKGVIVAAIRGLVTRYPERLDPHYAGWPVATAAGISHLAEALSEWALHITPSAAPVQLNAARSRRTAGRTNAAARAARRMLCLAPHAPRMYQEYLETCLDLRAEAPVPSAVRRMIVVHGASASVYVRALILIRSSTRYAFRAAVAHEAFRRFPNDISVLHETMFTRRYAATAGVEGEQQAFERAFIRCIVWHPDERRLYHPVHITSLQWNEPETLLRWAVCVNPSEDVVWAGLGEALFASDKRAALADVRAMSARQRLIWSPTYLHGLRLLQDGDLDLAFARFQALNRLLKYRSSSGAQAMRPNRDWRRIWANAASDAPDIKVTEISSTEERPLAPDCTLCVSADPAYFNIYADAFLQAAHRFAPRSAVHMHFVELPSRRLPEKSAPAVSISRETSLSMTELRAATGRFHAAAALLDGGRGPVMVTDIDCRLHADLEPILDGLGDYDIGVTAIRDGNGLPWQSIAAGYVLFSGSDISVAFAQQLSGAMARAIQDTPIWGVDQAVLYMALRSLKQGYPEVRITDLTAAGLPDILHQVGKFRLIEQAGARGDDTSLDQMLSRLEQAQSIDRRLAPDKVARRLENLGVSPYPRDGVPDNLIGLPALLIRYGGLSRERRIDLLDRLTQEGFAYRIEAGLLGASRAR